jgi:hypothetical protein
MRDFPAGYSTAKKTAGLATRRFPTYCRALNGEYRPFESAELNRRQRRPDLTITGW